ncbi:MAG: DNA alkylation repair protein, partial [Thermoplasmatota archaeon]
MTATSFRWMSAFTSCSMSTARRCRDIIARLEALQSEENIDGMKRFGITGRAYGVRMPELRMIAKDVGRNHELATALWAIDIRETRILASLIDEPGAVTRAQMEDWAALFDGWEICDQCCMNLFRKTSGVERIALEWSRRREEFVKRAGYVLMATLAIHHTSKDKEFFQECLAAVRQEADDARRYVKKAVSWALRQIGKRSPELNVAAITV